MFLLASCRHMSAVYALSRDLLEVIGTLVSLACTVSSLKVFNPQVRSLDDSLVCPSKLWTSISKSLVWLEELHRWRELVSYVLLFLYPSCMVTRILDARRFWTCQEGNSHCRSKLRLHFALKSVFAVPVHEKFAIIFYNYQKLYSIFLRNYTSQTRKLLFKTVP